MESHAPGEIRTRNPSKWVAADRRIRTRGHRRSLCLNINIDKYTDFLCNTTAHFYCNTATCCGLLQHYHQVVEVSLRGITRGTQKEEPTSIIRLTSRKSSPEYILQNVRRQWTVMLDRKSIDLSTSISFIGRTLTDIPQSCSEYNDS
jgi:hypothetical protein